MLKCFYAYCANYYHIAQWQSKYLTNHILSSESFRLFISKMPIGSSEDADIQYGRLYILAAPNLKWPERICTCCRATFKEIKQLVGG
jgi:hypothetical protein